ncbi:NmrA/HSCARG family protein [Telluria aromaticivorans]|uniref:NmrA/HSCARG family protein n=1 Tax=Telluria aromaticivorans TaxID=2725995 RepID=A0A7Y2K3L3_9BURK|nr:NmrA/HSCARG family protein [Telluria aromaticivorans]NNG25465.1 NmrA/HSCARG family protein [Telluria aromaticivorans]
MSNSHQPIVVFGATGQQGGSVAKALLSAGWPVRAMVRDVTSAKATALCDAGAELVQGSYADSDAIRAAMRGAHGVFSVQQSSPSGQVTDEEEVRFGKAIADLAVECGVTHLVYSSGAAVSDKPTGMGHFDSKMRIEAHVRSLPIKATIIRPVAFIDMLVMPGFGLDEGRFNFFMQPDQSIQLLAVEDIGKFVEPIFADPDRFGGQTFDIASDEVTGKELEALFSEAAGRPIPYARFSDEVLAASPFLAKLTALMDEGPLAGRADLEALRKINPEMQSVRDWLGHTGRDAFLQALGTAGTWAYDRT